MARIATTGLLLYVLVVAAVSLIEWSLSTPSDAWVRGPYGPTTRWWDIVYFNFISILTVGYGDYSPVTHGARFLTVLEAILGNAVFGLTIAAVTAKFLSPPENAIVFSRYAYYCTDDERFLVIYFNTSRTRLVNAEISSYFKLAGDWLVTPAVMSPFVTRAVQTFYTDGVPEKDIIAQLNDSTDALRFGIRGQLGAGTASAAIEYTPSDILVIPNRQPLIAYPGFWDPDFRSKELQQMFHYFPQGAPTLWDYVSEKRRQGE
jgi:Ion channel